MNKTFRISALVLIALAGALALYCYFKSDEVLPPEAAENQPPPQSTGSVALLTTENFPEPGSGGVFRFEPLESNEPGEIENPPPAPTDNSPGVLLPTAASFTNSDHRFVFYRQNEPPRSALFVFPAGEDETSEGIPLETIELGDHLYQPLFRQNNLFLFETTIDLGAGNEDRSQAVSTTHIKRVDLDSGRDYPITGPAVIEGELDDVVFLAHTMLVVANEGQEQDFRRIGYLFNLEHEESFSEPNGIPLPGLMCGAQSDGNYIYTTSVDDRRNSTFYVSETEHGQVIGTLPIAGAITGCSYEDDGRQARLWLKEQPAPLTLDLSDPSDPAILSPTIE